MRTLTLLTTASSVCLALATTSVLANTKTEITSKSTTKLVTHKKKSPKSKMVVHKRKASPYAKVATHKEKPSHKAKPVTHKTHKKVPAHIKIQQLTPPKITEKHTVKQTVKQPKKVQAPAPVNLSHKYFGFGPRSRIQINGFMSAGVAATDVSNDVKYGIPGHGTVGKDLGFAANSLAGLQITGNITPKLSAVLQVTATGEDINGQKSYRPMVDWAFIRYKYNNNLQFRAGRMRIPAFLYSQTEEVGLTYVPVFLPPEVYRLLPFYNFNGVDLTYSKNLGNSGWVAKFNPFFGENKSDYDLYSNAPELIPNGTTATFHENYMYGGNVNISNQYVTLNATYAHTNITMDLPSYVLPNPAAPGQYMPIPAAKGVVKDKGASFFSTGAKLNYHHWLIVSEFAHRSTPDRVASLSGAYGMVGYRIEKFLPYFIYARLWTTNKSKIKTPGSELAEAQQSFTVGTDYYINKNLVAKVGVSRITPLDGTNGLFNGNPGEKHVLMYTASLDIAF